MHKKMNKLVVLLTVLMMVVMATGCQGGSKDKVDEKKGATNSEGAKQEEPVTITFWNHWSSGMSKEVGEEIIADFHAAYPNIRIQIDSVENESYKTKIKTAIAANEGPDVFFSWGAGFAKPFVESGKVLGLNEAIGDGTKDKILPGRLEYFTYNGEVYGLPTTMWAGTFYCNTELFDQYNVKIPETYDELLLAVKTFRENGVTPMTVGEKDRWPGMLYHNMLAVRTAGAEASNKALVGEGSFDTPDFIDASNRLKELIRLGAFNDGALGLTRDESEVPFIQGQIPMYFNGNWVVRDIEKEGSPVKGKIVAKRFPVITDGRNNPSEFLGGAIQGLMISANTKHKEEAIIAAKYIAERRSLLGFYGGLGLPTWQAEIDNSRVNPVSAQIVELTKDATAFVLAWDTFLEGADADTHKNLVQELFADTMTPEAFSKEMQQINEK